MVAYMKVVIFPLETEEGKLYSKSEVGSKRAAARAHQWAAVRTNLELIIAPGQT